MDSSRKTINFIRGSSNTEQYRRLPNMQAVILAKLFDIKDLPDVVLMGVQQQVNESRQPIQTYRALLAAGSEFFRGLFTSIGFSDSNKLTYTLENVSHASLERAVEFLHRGSIELPTDDAAWEACDLLITANFLIMDELIVACETFLRKNYISVETCLELWKTATKHEFANLISALEECLAENFATIVKQEGFLHLDLHELCRFLSLKSVTTSTSGDVRFQAACAWLKHSTDRQQAHSDAVLNALSLTCGTISRKILIGECWQGGLSNAASGRVFYLISNAFNCSMTDLGWIGPDLVITATDTEPMSPMPPILPTPVVSSNAIVASRRQQEISSLYVAGNNSSNQLLEYKLGDFSWTELDPMPWKRSSCAASVVDDTLMLFGGYKNDETTHDWDCYSISTASWKTKAIFKTSPAAAAATDDWDACSNGNSIFLLCGNNQVVMNYSPNTDEHRQLSPMLQKRSKFATVYSSMPNDNSLYVAGGLDEDGRLLHRVDKYDITNNSWSQAGFMFQTRARFGMAMCGDDLYMCGGSDMNFRSNTAGVFNVHTGKHRAISNMTNEHDKCKAVLLYDNVVCVLGGSRTRAVDAYDVREGKWTTGRVVRDMPKESSYFVFAWR